jgi:hypothetical protein
VETHVEVISHHRSVAARYAAGLTPVDRLKRMNANGVLLVVARNA